MASLRDQWRCNMVAMDKHVARKRWPGKISGTRGRRAKQRGLVRRRWALRVLWELRDGPIGFRALQARCGEPSPSSLSQRLGELSEGRIVETTDHGSYRYSREGGELMRLLLPRNRWANRWGKRTRR